MGMMGAIVAWLRGRETAELRGEPDLTPADGVVEIVAAPGLRGEPNPRDTRFLRFSGIDPCARPLGPRPPRSVSKYPPLLGRVAIGSLFLGRDGAGWDDQEVARALAALIRAAEWIEREAMRWSAGVNLAVLRTYFAALDPEAREREVALAILPEGEGEGLFDADAEVRLVASTGRAARALGFRDVADLVERTASTCAADVLVWVIHVRSAGRSFVVPESETGMRGVSLAVCYAREDDFPGRLLGAPYSDPATFAHELLHLFGASDKYGVPLSGFPKGEVTGRDVMRLEVETLSRLRIDPATAREIGWPDNAKPPAATGGLRRAGGEDEGG